MSILRTWIRRRMSADIRQARRLGAPTRERDGRQGGGKFTKPSPKVRRNRRRQANATARMSRKANR